MAVLGPNGAGKSTLLSILTGASRATAGELVLLGHSMSSRSGVRAVQDSLGFVPQALSIFPGHTVEDFLRYVCWLRKVPAATVPQAITSSLVATDLEELRDRRVRTLSGGMKQRLLLAQALVNSPALIVLDEPTVGLDPAQRARFLERVRGLSQRCRVVLATHLVEDVATTCDWTLVLDSGRVRFCGTTRELVARFGADEVTGASVEAAYRSVVAELAEQ